MFDLVTGFALVGVVLVISALASPLVERAPSSFPIIFLGLGFALGPVGLDFLPIDAHDTVVEVVATFTLALVLFLDAVKIQVDELGKHWLVPLLIIGPGTILIVLLIAGATWLVLSLAVLPALLVGAALASTDPVAATLSKTLGYPGRFDRFSSSKPDSTTSSSFRSCSFLSLSPTSPRPARGSGWDCWYGFCL